MPESANNNLEHPGVTPGEDVNAFRAHFKLSQADLDRLFGFVSGGRTSRRWEAQGAPRYVRILMAYAHLYGLDVMEHLAKESDDYWRDRA